jgi:hypothetical protein
MQLIASMDDNQHTRSKAVEHALGWVATKMGLFDMIEWLLPKVGKMVYLGIRVGLSSKEYRAFKGRFTVQWWLTGCLPSL